MHEKWPSSPNHIFFSTLLLLLSFLLDIRFDFRPLLEQNRQGQLYATSSTSLLEFQRCLEALLAANGVPSTSGASHFVSFPPQFTN